MRRRNLGNRVRLAAKNVASVSPLSVLWASASHKASTRIRQRCMDLGIRPWLLSIAKGSKTPWTRALEGSIRQEGSESKAWNKKEINHFFRTTWPSRFKVLQLLPEVCHRWRWVFYKLTASATDSFEPPMNAQTEEWHTCPHYPSDKSGKQSLHGPKCPSSRTWKHLKRCVGLSYILKLNQVA